MLDAESYCDKTHASIQRSLKREKSPYTIAETLADS